MSIFGSFFGSVSRDLGIDLGTANTLVYVKGKGIVINEPSVVAINKKTGQILAIGSEAKKMVGRTPAHIVAIKPLMDGVVSDFEVTQQMLKYFIEKVHQESFTLFPRPRVVIGIPSGVTEVERRAVEDAAINAGARQAFLIEEPMAAAIGARLPVQESSGCMICDIGGGTTEVAIISLGGIVLSKSLRIAGNELNDDIVQYTRSEFNLLIGERTAEDVKIRIGCTYPQDTIVEMIICGRDLISGLPKEMKINSEQVREAISHSVNIIVDEMKNAISEAPPELLGDIIQRGIILAGGGSLLRGLPRLIAEQTQVPVHVADDPLTCVVRGCGIVLENIDELKDVLVTTEYAKPTKKKIF